MDMMINECDFRVIAVPISSKLIIMNLFLNIIFSTEKLNNQNLLVQSLI